MVGQTAGVADEDLTAWRGGAEDLFCVKKQMETIRFGWGGLNVV
jgi:hypothetical protein